MPGAEPQLYETFPWSTLMIHLESCTAPLLSVALSSPVCGSCLTFRPQALGFWGLGFAFLVASTATLGVRPLFGFSATFALGQAI